MLIHKRIRDLIDGVKRYIFLKGILGIIICANYILQAVFLGRLVGQLYQRVPIFEMRSNIIVLAILLISRIFFVWGDSIYGKWIVGSVKNTLRKRAYDKLLNLGPGYMTTSRTGKLESTIVAGVDYLEGYLTQYIPQVLTCLIGSGAMIIYIFTINTLLGIIVLISAIIALIMPILYIKVLSVGNYEHWQAYLDLNAEFVDKVQGMMTLKAFNANERIGKEIKQKMNKLFLMTMKNIRTNVKQNGISGFMTGIGTSFSLAIAAYLTVKGDIEISQMTVLLFMLFEVFRPIIQLNMYWHYGFMGMTSTDGIMELFDAKEFVQDGTDDSSEQIQRTPPSIEFKNVDFSYGENEAKVFKDISFEIKPGEKLAVVGESGSGKTTLTSLILRFYDPTNGAIYYNGKDIKDIKLSFLRNKMAMVTQDTYLFNGTIEENLRLAKQDASEKELIDACIAANIHSFIMSMPDGYKTKVGERGLNLSGGQRQRIAIARALLKNAQIIILDEATSSVDVENERDIQESLERLLENKTAITIAHRLSTIKNADRILVLRDGKIVEEGRHQDLIDKKAYYYRLILAQNEGV